MITIELARAMHAEHRLAADCVNRHKVPGRRSERFGIRRARRRQTGASG